MRKELLINSIFTSIDGEVNKFGQGRISTFIRLSGCNLQCPYCDTKSALKEGSKQEILDVLKQVVEVGCPKITITGGEPLLQSDNLWILIQGIKQFLPECQFTIETNGTINPFEIIPPVDYIGFVVDYKLPNSGIKPKIDCKKIYGNLRDGDFIKFVISDKKDYDIAKKIVFQLKKISCANFSFGTVYGQMEHENLLDMMIRDNLYFVILNCQIHKFINLL